jgi:hypothetical protein
LARLGFWQAKALQSQAKAPKAGQSRAGTTLVALAHYSRNCHNEYTWAEQKCIHYRLYSLGEIIDFLIIFK